MPGHQVLSQGDQTTRVHMNWWTLILDPESSQEVFKFVMECFVLFRERDCMCSFLILTKTSVVINSVFCWQPTSSPPLSLTTLETFLQQETKVAELLFSSGNKRSVLYSPQIKWHCYTLHKLCLPERKHSFRYLVFLDSVLLQYCTE